MRSSLPTLLIVAVILSSCGEVTTENAAIAGVKPVAAVDAAPRKPQQPSLFAVIKAGLAENAKKAEAKQLARKGKATPEPAKPEVAATENIAPVTVAAVKKKPSLFQSIKNRLAENAAKAKAKQDQRRLSKSEANSEALAAPSTVQTEPAKPINKNSSTATKPRATNSQDLAEQLREPDMLNRIDTEEPNQNASPPSKPPGGNPVIIKGDAGPVLPTVPKTTPAPPIGKP